MYSVFEFSMALFWKKKRKLADQLKNCMPVTRWTVICFLFSFLKCPVTPMWMWATYQYVLHFKIHVPKPLCYTWQEIHFTFYIFTFVIMSKNTVKIWYAKLKIRGIIRQWGRGRSIYWTITSLKNSNISYSGLKKVKYVCDLRPYSSRHKNNKVPLYQI